MPLHALLLGLTTFAPLETDAFALVNGDRVVFYGDSITDYGAYPAMIETFVATRYPNLNVQFSNAGVGGERVGGGGLGLVDVRLSRDLFARRPTVVTAMLGMNDAEYRAFDPGTFSTFEKGYGYIADRLQREAPNARVWLFRPTPYDDVTKAASFPGGYNEVLLRYADAVTALAKSRGYGLVDLNAPLVSVLERAKVAKPEFAVNLIPDRIHPIPQMHVAIAERILQAWNADPLVSSTRVDWSTGRATTERATLSAWKGGSFRLKEAALPMPLDRKDAFAILVNDVSGFDDALNRETLAIDGMPEGRYTLKIDGERVGAFTNAEFVKGVNLATLDTPMVRQARRVADLTNRMAGLRGTRWRAIELPFAKAPAKERDAVVTSMKRLEAALADERRKAAQPVEHRFEIAREEA